MHTRTAVTGLLAAAALLTACSSSSHDSATPPATTTASAAATTQDPGADRQALTAAAEAYTAAFFKPDADATYELLSERCRKTTSVPELKRILAASTLTYGTPAVKSTQVNSLSGDSARVTVHYVKPPMPETPQPWTREGGAWRFNGCS
jgi:hypothetical protein